MQDGAFLLPGCCDPFNDKALRAARGASFQLRIVSSDWAHLDSLRNRFRMAMLAGHPDNGDHGGGGGRGRGGGCGTDASTEEGRVGVGGGEVVTGHVVEDDKVFVEADGGGDAEVEEAGAGYR
ncbi:hypothetical protein QJS10_CPB20g00548 [Acorus calamus]|uniref:Uncharacterized protein n=1 Tax=Acorus calamus TaxID=4465 RepID=A0AAV9C8Z5_ACOCL|nr:hypothetical protein QJS10_CPB20g00548 [Acorus calamus]